MPELAGAEVPGDKDEALVVIGLGMREDQIIDLQDALFPEEGCYHPFPHIEISIEASPVDQHARAPGKFYQRTVPLSDIEEGHVHALGCVAPHAPIRDVRPRDA